MNKISIIIPAYNEESCLENTINIIREYPPQSEFEIVVVDNNSTDQTSAIAQENADRTVQLKEGHVSAVRNFGVNSSTGDILIFLDADVLVTELWSENLQSVIQSLDNDPMQITGSRCLASKNESWLTKHWYSLLSVYDAPYVNSGHLITTRHLFEAVGGFDENLETAEDYDFCIRAKALGSKVINASNLPVYHLGYPTSLLGFIRREMWHGKQDFTSVSAIKNSKIALLSIINFILLFVAIIFLVEIEFFIIIPVYIFFVMSIFIFLSNYKFGFKNINNIFFTAFIFYCYTIGRTLSFFLK